MRRFLGNFKDSFRGNQRGQSLVELAITLPILALIIMIGLDFGRVYYFQVTMLGAVREAARTAAISASTDTAIKQVIYDSVNNRLTLTNANITITPSTRRAGDSVDVQARYEFEPATPMLARLLDPDNHNGGALEITVHSTAAVQ